MIMQEDIDENYQPTQEGKHLPFCIDLPTNLIVFLFS